MISALALVVKAISPYYRKLAWMRLRYHQYAQTFCEGGVRISSTAVRRRWRMTIWLWQKHWGTRLPSPGV
ncbi:hypothetical protein ACLK19_00145 [Escherichia coli]